MIFCLLENSFCDNFFNIKNSTISFQSYFLYRSFFWRNSLIPLPIPQKFMVHHKARTRVCSIILPVFHHLYHVQPRKVYPKEASEMVAHEAHASWTGVDSLNIQHLALCRSLMLQARQLLKKKNKGIGLQQKGKDVLKWSVQKCSKIFLNPCTIREKIWWATTLHMDIQQIQKAYRTQWLK